MPELPFDRRRFLQAAATLTAASTLPGFPAAADQLSWLAEVQRAPARLPEDAPQLPPLLVDDSGQPITTLPGWLRRREELRRWWLEFLGPLRVERGQVPSLRVLEQDRPHGVVRQLVQYQSEPGLEVEAYLLKPAEVTGKCPGVVVLHSTVPYTIRQPAGVEGEPSKAFGLRLAQQGWVAFCPRCFLWSQDPSIGYQEQVRRFQSRHPGARGMAKMLYDAQLAVDILAALPEVDPRQLAAVGHSLGAKEALYLAAFDERIRAVVSSEGGIGTRFSNWDAAWYLGPEICEPGFTHEHHELLGLAAPRAFLLVGGDSADGDRSWPFVQAASEVYDLHGGPPRWGLFNHRQGHSVPPEAQQRIEQWLQAYGREP